jgi:NAD+ synthase
LNPPTVTTEVLNLDYAKAAQTIEQGMRAAASRLSRRGYVLGVSGGIDSSVCAMMAARAVGSHRVFALLMPETDSSPESLEKGRTVCAAAGIESEVVDIAPALAALGCYRLRDEAIRKVFPSFVAGDRFKIAVGGDTAHADHVSYFSLIAELSAEGNRRVTARMPVDVYLAIVAATNMKQRVRKLLEYSRADALNYAVIGTPNRLEYDQGFFVRGGDGLADVKPIAHLYKTQVFGMARWLGLPPVITEQMPSTDTYSLPQSQEEFYFRLPYGQMDLLLWAYVHRVPAESAAASLGLETKQVAWAYRDIEAKRRVADRLDGPAQLLDPTCARGVFHDAA